MNDNTLTLALNGDVGLPEFTQAMGHFNELVKNLSEEIAGDKTIEWVIDSLEGGSAIATIRGISSSLDLVAAVILAYLNVGKAIQAGRVIPYSEKVTHPAYALSRLVNDRIPSIRFETASEDVTIVNPYVPGAVGQNRPTYAFGTMKGMVQTLSRRRGVRFTLYDVLFDRAVSCYLREGQEEMVRDFWGKKVVVTGKIGRDGQTGKPFSIRDITQINEFESSPPGSWRRARGVFRLAEGETAASVVRRLRDA